MKREELVEKIAVGISILEGYHRLSLAWQNRNPGNIEYWWGEDGKKYPRWRGYVDFVAWAIRHWPPGAKWADVERMAEEEGWRVLRTVVGQYIDGVYTDGKLPTLYEMFAHYLPTRGRISPEVCANYVANGAKIPPEIPLRQLIDVE
jgi:hypothetical protein